MCCIAQFGCSTGGPHAAKNNSRAVGCSWGVSWRAGLIWHLLLVTLIFLRLNTKQKAFNMLYMCWRHHPDKQLRRFPATMETRQEPLAVLSAKGTVTFGPPSKSMIYAKGNESNVLHYLTAIHKSSRRVFDIMFQGRGNVIWESEIIPPILHTRHRGKVGMWAAVHGKLSHIRLQTFSNILLKFSQFETTNLKNAQSWLPRVKHALIHFITYMHRKCRHVHTGRGNA